ncbi:hypothetical protein GEMRC1_012966 [Eukaryota sp. GEM-RC1]
MTIFISLDHHISASVLNDKGACVSLLNGDSEFSAVSFVTKPPLLFDDALNHATPVEEATFYHFLTHLGATSEQEPGHEPLLHPPYSYDSSSNLVYTYMNETFHPTTLLSMIFSEIKSRSARLTKSSDVIISTPSYLTQHQRNLVYSVALNVGFNPTVVPPFLPVLSAFIARAKPDSCRIGVVDVGYEQLSLHCFNYNPSATSPTATSPLFFEDSVVSSEVSVSLLDQDLLTSLPQLSALKRSASRNSHGDCSLCEGLKTVCDEFFTKNPIDFLFIQSAAQCFVKEIREHFSTTVIIDNMITQIDQSIISDWKVDCDQIDCMYGSNVKQVVEQQIDEPIDQEVVEEPIEQQTDVVEQIDEPIDQEVVAEPIEQQADVVEQIDEPIDQEVVAEPIEQQADVVEQIDEPIDQEVVEEPIEQQADVVEQIDEPIDQEVVEEPIEQQADVVEQIDEPIDQEVVEEPIEQQADVVEQIDEPIDQEVVEEPIEQQADVVEQIDEPIDQEVVEEPIEQHADVVEQIDEPIDQEVVEEPIEQQADVVEQIDEPIVQEVVEEPIEQQADVVEQIDEPIDQEVVEEPIEQQADVVEQIDEPIDQEVVEEPIEQQADVVEQIDEPIDQEVVEEPIEQQADVVEQIDEPIDEEVVEEPIEQQADVVEQIDEPIDEEVVEEPIDQDDDVHSYRPVFETDNELSPSFSRITETYYTPKSSMFSSSHSELVKATLSKVSECLEKSPSANFSPSPTLREVYEAFKVPAVSPSNSPRGTSPRVTSPAIGGQVFERLTRSQSPRSLRNSMNSPERSSPVNSFNQSSPSQKRPTSQKPRPVSNDEVNIGKEYDNYDHDTLYNMACEIEKSGNYNKAFGFYLKSAEFGNPKACFMVALYYAGLHGKSENHHRCKVFVNKAAELGSKLATVILDVVANRKDELEISRKNKGLLIHAKKVSRQMSFHYEDIVQNVLKISRIRR